MSPDPSPSLPLAPPADLGLCPVRTQALWQVLQGEIDRQRLPGAVVLLARHGRIGLFEALGCKIRPLPRPWAKTPSSGCFP